MLIKPIRDKNGDLRGGSSGLKFSKIQKLAFAFLLLALVALSATVVQLTTKPQATLRSIADSDDATGNAFFTQRETLVLAINFERWLSGYETKRAVLIRRALLGQRLNVKDAKDVSNAQRASAAYLQALQEIDTCLANEIDGTLSESRRMVVRKSCADSLEVLVFEARQLGVDISGAGDVRLREIIDRDRDGRNVQIIQMLLIVATLMLGGGLLGLSRTRALQRVKRVVENDQRELKDARDSLTVLEAQIEERIISDERQRIEDRRLDLETRLITTDLRKATSSKIAIKIFANGLHRLIESDLTYVQFFAGAEEGSFAYLIDGDAASGTEFSQIQIDQDFNSEMIAISQQVWNKDNAGPLSLAELKKNVPPIVLSELQKFEFNHNSSFMPVGEGQLVLGFAVFAPRIGSSLMPHQLAALQNVVSQAANAIGAIRSTSLVEKIRENEQVVSELRALDRLKDEFTANVNHELRTPLTSIIGYLELVLSDSQNLPEKTLSYLATVRRNADRLTELIERLLVVAKSDNASAEFPRDEVDLAEVVRDAVQAVGQKDPSKSVKIEIEIDQADFRLIGDRLRLQQIVINLVGNAVKFSKEYSTVSVFLRHLQNQLDGSCKAELVIKDSGIGIPANEVPDLFNRFFRASNATKALIPGTGLGLSIVKQFVEDHNGEISVDSVIGQGTTVSVRIPLAPIKLV